jgi:uncharacterized protein
VDPQTNDALTAIAETLKRIEDLLSMLPGELAKDMRGKLAQIRGVVLEQRPPSLVLIGRRGAGKSSLVNAFFGNQVAAVGHVRAQTAQGTWYAYENERGSLSILDTRGLQEGSRPEGAGPETALETALLEIRKHAPDVVLFLAKATEIDAAIDKDLDDLEAVLREAERVHHLKPPVVGVVTHCDVLEPKATALHPKGDRSELEAADLREKLVHIAQAERHLEDKLRARSAIAPKLATVVGVSSYLSFRDDGSLRADERYRIESLAEALFKHIPDAGRGIFVRIAQVRGLQEQLAADITRTIAAICAGVAVVPIPVADIFPITSLQLALIMIIAWLGGRDLSLAAAKEFMAAMGVNVGIAFAFREGARALVKFVFPGAGSAVSGVVAFAGTMAIGRAARSYFLNHSSIDEAKRQFEAREDGPPKSGT